MTLSQLNTYLSAVSEQHLIVGYGSLMNADSRKRFSGIPHEGLPVHLSGFARGWVTRSIHEGQTYAGALPDTEGSVNGQLIPVEMNPALAERERDYVFTQVSPDALTFVLDDNVADSLHSWLSDRKIWICETTQPLPAEAEFPVSQTYIDTCLAGCLEMGGEEEARHFIRHTTHWPAHIRNDRAKPAYPRAGNVSADTHATIDRLLEACL